jgi:hypothetical protein
MLLKEKFLQAKIMVSMAMSDSAFDDLMLVFSCGVYQARKGALASVIWTDKLRSILYTLKKSLFLM